MDNTEKLLRAFIKAQGYEIEETLEQRITPNGQILIPHDYKVTKRKTLQEYIQECWDGGRKCTSDDLLNTKPSITFGPSILQ